jgi:hypothetical protein
LRGRGAEGEAITGVLWKFGSGLSGDCGESLLKPICGRSGLTALCGVQDWGVNEGKISGVILGDGVCSFLVGGVEVGPGRRRDGEID